MTDRDTTRRFPRSATGTALSTLLLCSLLLTTACKSNGGESSGGSPAALPQSTLDGAFTVEQADRGRDVYAGMCMSCHAGMGNHVGPIFKARWAGLHLSDMYKFISEEMPKNDPGSLAPEQSAEVIAYLLQMNGMPAGKVPVPVEMARLEGIRFDTLNTNK